MRFSGKTALVTGAARGIGAAIARRLADEGAHVLGLDQLPFDGQVLASGGRIEAVQADLADTTLPASLLSHYRSQTLDFLINNAGIGNSKSIDRTSDADWSRYLDINLGAAFRMCRDLLPVLTPGNASIINMTSIFGLVGFPNSLPYSVSKAGLAHRPAPQWHAGRHRRRDRVPVLGRCRVHHRADPGGGWWLVGGAVSRAGRRDLSRNYAPRGLFLAAA